MVVHNLIKPNEFVNKIKNHLVDIVWSKLKNPENYVEENEKVNFLGTYTSNSTYFLEHVWILVNGKILNNHGNLLVPFENLSVSCDYFINDFLDKVADKIYEFFKKLEVFIHYYKKQKDMQAAEVEVYHHINQCIIFTSIELKKINIEIDQKYVQQFIDSTLAESKHYEKIFYSLIGGILTLIVLIIFFILYYYLSLKIKTNSDKLKSNETRTPENNYTLEENGFSFYEKVYDTLRKKVDTNTKIKVVYYNEITNEPIYQNTIVLNDLKNIEMILSSNSNENNFYEEIT